MKFQILARWPSEDILPMRVECDSATAAISQYRTLTKSGIEVVEIQALEDDSAMRISAYRLNTLSRAERALPKPSKRKTHQVIAGALLSMIASALPNYFGDFGVVSGHGVLRAARSSRASKKAPFHYTTH